MDCLALHRRADQITPRDELWARGSGQVTSLVVDRFDIMSHVLECMDGPSVFDASMPPRGVSMGNGRLYGHGSPRHVFLA